MQVNAAQLYTIISVTRALSVHVTVQALQWSLALRQLQLYFSWGICVQATTGLCQALTVKCNRSGVHLQNSRTPLPPTDRVCLIANGCRHCQGILEIAGQINDITREALQWNRILSLGHMSRLVFQVTAAELAPVTSVHMHPNGVATIQKHAAMSKHDSEQQRIQSTIQLPATEIFGGLVVLLSSQHAIRLSVHHGVDGYSWTIFGEGTTVIHTSVIAIAVPCTVPELEHWLADRADMTNFTQQNLIKTQNQTFNCQSEAEAYMLVQLQHISTCPYGFGTAAESTYLFLALFVRPARHWTSTLLKYGRVEILQKVMRKVCGSWDVLSKAMTVISLKALYLCLVLNIMPEALLLFTIIWQCPKKLQGFTADALLANNMGPCGALILLSVELWQQEEGVTVSDHKGGAIPYACFSVSLHMWCLSQFWKPPWSLSVHEFFRWRFAELELNKQSHAIALAVFLWLVLTEVRKNFVLARELTSDYMIESLCTMALRTLTTDNRDMATQVTLHFGSMILEGGSLLRKTRQLFLNTMHSDSSEEMTDWVLSMPMICIGSYMICTSMVMIPKELQLHFIFFGSLDFCDQEVDYYPSITNMTLPRGSEMEEEEVIACYLMTNVLQPGNKEVLYHTVADTGTLVLTFYDLKIDDP